VLLGVPVGVGAGIYLAEYGRNRFGDAIRFTADVLNGVPSIVIGIVAYSIVVLYQKHFSALAGGVALAIMMIPTITRTTEEMLLLVPQALREAAYGLGHSALADDALDHAAHGDFRRDYGNHAGLCAGGG
jgi:phosphate transport system permease protein